jgi:hypothetical protein
VHRPRELDVVPSDEHVHDSRDSRHGETEHEDRGAPPHWLTVGDVEVRCEPSKGGLPIHVPASTVSPAPSGGADLRQRSGTMSQTELRRKLRAFPAGGLFIRLLIQA